MKTYQASMPVGSLAFHALPAREQFIKPDFFDASGSWHRSLLVDGEPVHFTVSPTGRIQANSQTQRPAAALSSALATLLVPVPLPAEAASLLPRSLSSPLEQMSPLIHIRSASLFEALIKAVLRQVIRAAHATELTDRFIKEFGQAMTEGGGRQFLFPTPERLATIGIQELQGLGVGFKARAIAAVSEAFLSDGEAIESIVEPLALIDRLCLIRGVGPWSARVAVADYLGAWSEYPIDDLAVRTWAARLWPRVQWPERPSDFANMWRRKTGRHTGVLTFYLLTFGLYQSSVVRKAVA